MRRSPFASTVLFSGALWLCSCSADPSSSPSPSPSNPAALLGSWNYSRWNGDMFDSARYTFQDGGKFEAQAVFHLRGSYYQIVYELGSWTATSDSLSLDLDTLYESRDSGRTFRPMSGPAAPIRTRYVRDGSRLTWILSDTAGPDTMVFVRE